MYLFRRNTPYFRIHSDTDFRYRVSVLYHQVPAMQIPSQHPASPADSQGYRQEDGILPVGESRYNNQCEFQNALWIQSCQLAFRAMNMQDGSYPVQYVNL